jgi:hypothetical protein
MYAVVATVRFAEIEDALRELRERVVPALSEAPGFVAGYWTRKDQSGLGLVIFESEEAARAMEERIPSLASEMVMFDELEVREVLAHA